MTLKEAWEKKLVKLRLPRWDKNTFILLDITDKGYGPWAKIHHANGLKSKIKMCSGLNYNIWEEAK